MNVLPYVTWNPKMLALTLFVLVSASAQWHIINQCIFSKYENGSDKSIFVLWLQDLTGLSYKAIGDLWVFFLNYVPSVVCIVKLFMLSQSK
jgi:hypothetical protein